MRTQLLNLGIFNLLDSLQLGLHPVVQASQSYHAWSYCNDGGCRGDCVGGCEGSPAGGKGY